MNVADLIEYHEGYSRFVYRCPADRLTVGIGRNLQDKGLSREEAKFLLANDIREITLELTERLPYFSSLSAPRQAVLIDMAFNLGVGGLMKFTNTLAAVEAGDFAKAAERMMQSKWATQVKRRAFRLAKMMETGEWPSFLG